MGCFETKAFPGVGRYGISDVIASVSPVSYRFSDHNLHNFVLELPTFSPNFLVMIVVKVSSDLNRCV